jgi:hypothetical protein
MNFQIHLRTTLIRADVCVNGQKNKFTHVNSRFKVKKIKLCHYTTNVEIDILDKSIIFNNQNF